jgi:dimethylhistidine N-methyltransferase
MRRVKPRLSVAEPRPGAVAADFFRDAEEGLSARPKRLSPVHFYDREGSQLFEAITRTPEYYLTRVERDILRRHAAEIAEGPPELALVELGSGSSAKTRALIEMMLARQRRLRYVAIDVSKSALLEAARELLADYRNLEMTACVGDYAAGLDWLSAQGLGPKLILSLGSSIGNLAPAEAVGLLSAARARMEDGDGFLLGADLIKEPRILEAAYNDAAGVTARFNMNLLRRVNEELGGAFRLEEFRHLARYDSRARKIEMHLVCGRRQDVPVRALGRSFHFEGGESIHTEDCRKYTLDELDAVAAAAGLRRARSWLDERAWFSVNLLRA